MSKASGASGQKVPTLARGFVFLTTLDPSRVSAARLERGRLALMVPAGRATVYARKLYDIECLCPGLLQLRPGAISYTHI
jgi:hypothetical protein